MFTVRKLNQMAKSCKNGLLLLMLLGGAMNKKQPNTIDEYISGFPEKVQDVLHKVRETIRKSAPDAEETINYQIPTFRLKGNLVHFAAFKKHIGFYPTPSGIKQFQQELYGFETSKGSVKFPLEKPIPYDLISKITEFRVMEQHSGQAE